MSWSFFLYFGQLICLFLWNFVLFLLLLQLIEPNNSSFVFLFALTLLKWLFIRVINLWFNLFSFQRIDVGFWNDFLLVINVRWSPGRAQDGVFKENLLKYFELVNVMIGQADENLFRFKELKGFLESPLVLFHKVTYDENKAAILAVKRMN